jgi:hypothetical protein
MEKEGEEEDREEEMNFTPFARTGLSSLSLSHTHTHRHPCRSLIFFFLLFPSLTFQSTFSNEEMSVGTQVSWQRNSCLIRQDQLLNTLRIDCYNGYRILACFPFQS